MSLRLSILAILCAASASAAEYALPSARNIDWSGAGVIGGIPTRNTIATTLHAGASVASIQSALNACPAGQVVLIDGNCTIDDILLFNVNNVTLRMATGVTLTMTASGAFVMRGQQYAGSAAPVGTPYAESAWTATSYAKGQTQITLDSIFSGHGDLQIGDYIFLDQENDPSLVNNVGSEDTYTQQLRDGRNQVQMVRVTAVSGNTVTFTPGLYASNWSASFNPRAWWVDFLYAGDNYRELSYSGIEGGTIDVNGHDIAPLIMLNSCANCWVKNVRIVGQASIGIELLRSAHCQVERCVAEGAQNYGSQCYAVNILCSFDSLIQDNIMHRVSSPVILSAGSAGNVVSYNYAVEQRYVSDANSFMPASIQSHGSHPMFNLIEGNFCNGVNFDVTHGSGSNQVVFRNRLPGRERVTQTSNTYGAFVMANNRNTSLVGNVLGTTGYHVNYEWSSSSGGMGSDPSNAQKSIFRVGHFDNNAVNGDPSNDATTVSSLVRVGNYNTVDAAIPSSETLSGATLPNSLYLAAKPGFFGTLTWPPFDPTSPAGITSASIPAGYRYANGTDVPVAGAASFSGAGSSRFSGAGSASFAQ